MAPNCSSLARTFSSHILHKVHRKGEQVLSAEAATNVIICLSFSVATQQTMTLQNAFGKGDKNKLFDTPHIHTSMDHQWNDFLTPGYADASSVQAQ